IGARQVFVMMDHLTRDGECKLVAQCSYPLTGVGCVSRIYTDLAVIDITDRGPVVREIFTGLSFEELQRITPVPLTFQQLAESA
ncbi:3-oxoadipate CoA-transferase subunit B, partial [Klebsiella pneumoniae]